MIAELLVVIPALAHVVAPPSGTEQRLSVEVPAVSYSVEETASGHRVSIADYGALFWSSDLRSPSAARKPRNDR